MKKYIIVLIALIGGLISCTNDDITISRNTEIEINPQYLMSGFRPYKVTDNLKFFDTNYNLRCHLLIYDNIGNLFYQEVGYLNNYTQIQRSYPDLPDGKYTVVAITDIVEYTNGTLTKEYWGMEDIERITSLKIKHQGELGFRNEVIGLKTVDIVVESGQSKTVQLNIEPAGALFIISYNNIHQYPNVIRLGVITEPVSSCIKFNSDGSPIYEYTRAESGYINLLSSITVMDNPSSTYAYHFVLPGQYNLNFGYSEVKDGGWINLYQSPVALNVEGGKEYIMSLDLYDENGEISGWIDEF